MIFETPIKDFVIRNFGISIEDIERVRQADLDAVLNVDVPNEAITYMPYESHKVLEEQEAQ